ncbi:mitosis inhibitor protein kinase swe1 [Vanrija albida]|uniref:Mitosis inhibitor protein kinase swe1 n=1 Tax=Vanrija albida TaxID=181172 RepID=A0ABR3PZ55_9TREE
MTPRRWPHMRKLSTPAAPNGRELSYPHTAPMPVIHSLLGSPFHSKSRAYPYELHSPTWVARPMGTEPLGQEDQDADWHAEEWIEEADALPELQPTRPRPVSSTFSHSSFDDFSGSCTSASSLFSSQRHSLSAIPTRPSVVSIWGEEDGEFAPPATPNRTTSLPRDTLLSPSRGLHLSPGETSPLRSKRAPSPVHAVCGGESPIARTFAMGRPPSTQPPPVERKRSTAERRTPSGSASLSRSPLSSFLPRLIKSAQKAPVRSDDGFGTFLNGEQSGALSLRRTSEPHDHSEDAYATFLARCGGDRATQSDLSHHQPWESPLPSSEPNELELELSPLRPMNGRTGFTSLPARSTSSQSEPPLLPSAPLLSFKNRFEKRASGSTPKAIKATPVRSLSARVPAVTTRPNIRRGGTDPSFRPEPTQLATPVAQLFGDDKPSPAAFASTGLVKKRGSRLSFPRFGSSVAKARNWTPMPKPADLKPTAAVVKATTKTRAPSTGDRVEAVQAEDLDELDQVSPIKPFWAAPFRRTTSSTSAHTRKASVASDIGTSPYRRPSGHARMSSTASSIGGNRGLRRKGSNMFASCGSIGSDAMSDKMSSPATPTKPLPLATVQPKYGVTTPSPQVASTYYPFARNATEAGSPSTSPARTRPARVRALSRAGPVARNSNPMLAATFRAHAAVMPATPAAGTTLAEGLMPDAARVAGAGRFENDFTLVQALGSGEFSNVWKVRSKADNDLWAVKTGRPYIGARNRLRQLEEVTILRQLTRDSHSGIIKFADSWEQNGRLFIRTELAECGDLGRYLLAQGDRGGLDEGRVWKMIVELSTALDYIHANDILHLDFKPSNVLITREGSLKVGDFGMSIIREPGLGRSTSTVRSGASGMSSREGSVTPPFEDDERAIQARPSPILDRELEGDREYLCPEALHDATPGPESDVYSLGILVLEAALNVTLPSNGEAWVKLRNDDFTDLDDHYVLRGATAPSASNTPSSWPTSAAGDPPTPVVSNVLLATIRQLMYSSPAARMTLSELDELGPMVRARSALVSEPGCWCAAGPALVEEDAGFIDYVLGTETHAL